MLRQQRGPAIPRQNLSLKNNSERQLNQCVLVWFIALQQHGMSVKLRQTNKQ